MKSLNCFIEILEKNYSNFTVIEEIDGYKTEYAPKGYIVAYYSADDLQDLDSEELEEFEKALKDGYYYTSGTVLLNERYNLKEQKTIYDEIDFPELEFQFKKIN